MSLSINHGNRIMDVFFIFLTIISGVLLIKFYSGYVLSSSIVIIFYEKGYFLSYAVFLNDDDSESKIVIRLNYFLFCFNNLFPK